MIIPPYLKRGDVVAITCPAGFMPLAKIQSCVRSLQSWGLEVWIGKTVGSNSSNYFSGTDEERRDELQALLDTSEVKAILCGRGGYGVSRIIDQLDFKRFRKYPKWIIGFSDITVLHSHLHQVVHSASLHAPMAAAFQDDEAKDDIASFKQALFGKKMMYNMKQSTAVQYGVGEGILIGGNLALLAHQCGTKRQLKTKGKILFLEDVGEYLYNIDRMMLQLKQSGVLEGLAGLVLGGFTDCKDTERPFGKNIDKILLEHIGAYDYPIVMHAPVSHAVPNLAFKCGIPHKLKISSRTIILEEIS